MNHTVRAHAQNIVTIAKRGEGFSKYGGLAASYGDVPEEHSFKISNINETETSYTCLIVNIEMGIDILEVSHVLLEKRFNRKFFENEFSKLKIDLEKPVYLIYIKYIG